MKKILIFILSLVPVICFPQINQFQYPEIKKEGKNITDFVPKGWTIMDEVSGEFNLDKLNDIALIIKSNKVLNADSTDPGSGFAPKILMILFKQPDKTWKLSCVATKIFDTTQAGVQNCHPYKGIKAMHDTLTITFATGGTVVDNTTYYFRFQNNDWCLVGKYMKEDDMQKSMGVYLVSYESVNFISGKVESGKYDPDTKRNKYDEKEIKVKPLIKLSEFDNRNED
ncbi:MAG: hypothetical protein ABI237_14305 [Ginsengibacter sp.]